MDLEDIQTALAATPVVLRHLVRGLSDAQLSAGHDAERWSIKEVLWHLRDTEEVFVERYRRIVAEDSPFLPGFDQEAYARERGYQVADAEAALRGFAEQRAKALALFIGLTDADLARRGTHEEIGAVTLGWLAGHIISHDLNHLAQITRAVS